MYIKHHKQIYKVAFDASLFVFRQCTITVEIKIIGL